MISIPSLHSVKRPYSRSVGRGPRTLGRSLGETKNIVTDYGAVPDGVTDCSTAFTNFRTWARSQMVPVLLFIPSGNYLILDDNINNQLFNGILQLFVSAYGASFVRTPNITGPVGFRQEAGYSARVNTVTFGSGSATLKTPSQSSRFFIGAWCCLGALEFQGSSGFPPNLCYAQFVQITAIDPIGGVISFTPSAKDTYSDQYPETNPGQDYDTGGPATLFLMCGRPGYVPLDTWRSQITINGLTITNSAGPSGEQVYASCLSISYADCIFSGCAPIPTANRTFSATRCTVPDAQIENDKDCESVTFLNCTLRSMITQSSSIQSLILDGNSISVFCNGTARKTLIKGSSNLNTLVIGPVGYGNSESLTIQAPVNITTLSDPVVTNHHVFADFANSSGNLTYQGSGVLSWGPPNATLFLGGNAKVFGRYTAIISDVTTSSDEPVLHTGFPDPLPTLPSQVGPTKYIVEHPCVSVTVAPGVTGDLDFVALSRPLAQGKPIRSYNYRQDNFGITTNMKIWGKLNTLRVNVIRAYTGAQPSALLHVGAPGDDASVIDSSGGYTHYGPIVNTKIVGQRLITPTTVSGSQSGDVLGGAPGTISFTDNIQPFLNADMSGDTNDQKPIIEVEILTDQF